jgi:hypothetical protein
LVPTFKPFANKKWDISAGLVCQPAAVLGKFLPVLSVMLIPMIYHFKIINIKISAVAYDLIQMKTG